MQEKWKITSQSNAFCKNPKARTVVLKKAKQETQLTAWDFLLVTQNGCGCRCEDVAQGFVFPGGTNSISIRLLFSVYCNVYSLTGAGNRIEINLPDQRLPKSG